jgi:hypothetical protein
MFGLIASLSRAISPILSPTVRHILGCTRRSTRLDLPKRSQWLKPGTDWRHLRGGGASPLEYADKVMRTVAKQIPRPEPSEDDLPVAAMRYTVAEH